MIALRYGLPAVIFVAGCVVWAVDASTAGLHAFAMATGAALSILFLNWLIRIGRSGDQERVAEEAARDYFAQHGRWPDES